jgi:aminomethyltransferase
MVVNGSMKFSDMAHFQKHLNEYDGDVTMEYLEDDMQLLALQGSGSADAISKLLPTDFNLKNMAFMTGVDTIIDGVENCRITRCGYTGEDGFEISIPSGISTIQIASKLISNPNVNPTGLGARDSLRLEAGLCLYGNDLNENINPIMGTLAWTLGKGGPNARRRQEQDFTGASSFLKEDGKLKKQIRKRIGIIGMKAPARQYTEIYDADGTNLIGEITSGTFSPCLKKPIAMGYIDTASSKTDTPIKLKIRNKMIDAQVTKMPFVESNYYRVPE